MVETTVLLKDQSEWRTVRETRWYSDWAPDPLRAWMRRLWPEERPLTWDELIQDIDPQVKIPGMINIFWMPVQTRTEMLNTGIRSNLGIKVFGSDLTTIESVAVEIEQALQDVPGTRSAFADRTAGGYFLDFDVNRDQAARYGLTVQDVQDIVESAIGGKNISFSVEGRERYPINVRYLRELRDDPEQLARVLVATPSGAQVPISLLADIRYTTGPPMIRDENAQLVGYVFVDVSDADYEGYVRRAQDVVGAEVQLPPGYRLEWAGQYQYLQRMNERLKVVVPLTLFLVFLLLYLNFNDLVKTSIVLLAVPFSLIGAVWILYLLDYNLSVAVWVGMIALAGLDAETGAVMLLYLDLAYQKWKSEGRMNDFGDLKEAIHHGAVQRVRPKVMTVGTTMIALMPILLASPMSTGADVMKRIAAPMVGGLVTSFVLTLTIYPAIFAIWKQSELEGWKAVFTGAKRLSRKEEGPEGMKPGLSAIWKFTSAFATAFIVLTLALAALDGDSGRSDVQRGIPVHQVVQDGSTISIETETGQLRFGENDLSIFVTDTDTGRLQQASDMSLDLFMPAMGAMPPMRDVADLAGIGPGEWQGNVRISMAGEWQVTITFDSPSGPLRITFPVTVQ